MEINRCSFFALLVLLILLTSIKPFLATTPHLNSTTDQNALLALKNTITSDPYEILAKNWTTNASVCNWIGVTCGVKHRRVTALNISWFNLTGTLPPHLGNLTFLRYFDISFNSFTGQIPLSFGTLPRLEQLVMNNNTFYGSIPPSLFKNSKLKILNMRFNYLNGSIPDEIDNSTSLQIVYLEFNQLTGSIPYGLFNLSSITKISIAFNYLSGKLPSDICNNLPNLKILVLSANQLEGQIPENICKCRDIEALSLSVNRFNGEIPSEIGSLSKLRVLYLGFNDLKGGIPMELGNLSRLEILSFQNCSLTGRPISKQIGNSTSLKQLIIFNNYLTGELPEELGNLAFLELFGLRNNLLSGPLPSSLLNISTLRILELSMNQFSGSLRAPLESNLEQLYLHTNQLSGEIPSSIANASKLTILSLSVNSFSGSMPNFINLRLLSRLGIEDNNLTGSKSLNGELQFLSWLSNCQYLTQLFISANPLNGVLPASIGNLSHSLEFFVAHESNIRGVIPLEIGNLSSLTTISLSGNQLTGLIPSTIGELKKLQKLYLDRNRLQGNIPYDLCKLSNMGDLFLYDNILTGPIPECFGQLQSLRNIYLGSNKLNSPIPSDFWNLRDLVFVNLSSNYLTGLLSSQIAGLKVLNLIDLSYNQLSGDIPSLIDGCQTLEFLFLSHNKFEGSIPPSLGNIKGLSVLDLSDNNLSGSIPKSLEGLNLLEYFNVSNNKLEGEIPTKGHFLNFTAQSFSNNSALCGESKFQVPHCTAKDDGISGRKKVVRLMKYILPPFISVIVLAIIIVLVLMRRRRMRRVPAQGDDILPNIAWRRVSNIELERGTSGFSETNLLGRGSFGSVFKSKLYDGLNVAVKVFNLQLERAIKSFGKECEILSQIRHRNLVRIIGCCSNIEFKALILEYMPNGSLEEWLYSENYCLDLLQRLEIAIDVASALEYLHHGYTYPVVHCDIKPSNVLLDEDMVARVGDFGIAKLFDEGETMVQTKTLATIGYAAPEYGSEGKVSTNGDVYSYGILLLELFTKKKPTDDMFSEDMSLKEWVNEALQEKVVGQVVAADLLAREDQHFCAKEECVSSVFVLAMKCLAVSPHERINMIETVGALKRIKAKIVAGTTRRQQYALSN